jgi:DNA repair ATPase RecN
VFLKEIKNPLNSSFNERKQAAILNDQRQIIIKELNAKVLPLNKEIAEAYKKERWKDVNKLRENKLSIIAKYKPEIDALHTQIQTLAPLPLLDKNINMLNAYNMDYNYLHALSDNFSQVSNELNKLRDALAFTEAEKASPLKLYKKLNKIKQSQYDLYSLTNRLDQITKEINEQIRQLYQNIKQYRQYMYNDSIYENSFSNKELKEKFKLEKDTVIKNLNFQAKVLSRAKTDISFQKPYLFDSARTINACERAINPLNAYKSILNHIPVARNVMQAVQLSSAISANPAGAALKAARFIGNQILSAGMGV